MSVGDEVEFDLLRAIGPILEQILNNDRHLAPKLFQRIGLGRQPIDIDFSTYQTFASSSQATRTTA
jgi:hypothetical protein